MKFSLNLFSTLSGILILCLFYHSVTSSPVGAGERTEVTELPPSNDEINTTQPPNKARQDGDGEETTLRSEGESGSSSSSATSPSSASVAVDEDSDEEEEDEETPTPTQAPALPSTTVKAPLQLNSTFNQEWSIVVASQDQNIRNQNQNANQNQLPNQIDNLPPAPNQLGSQVPNQGENQLPNQAPNEIVPNQEQTENKTETDKEPEKEVAEKEKEKENEKENETETENEEENKVVARQGETETETGADIDQEDKDEDNDETTIKAQVPSSTLKYTNVIDEWNVVTGNVSSKDSKKSQTKTKTGGKPSGSLDLSSATFDSEWETVNSITTTGLDPNKPVSDTESVTEKASENDDEENDNRTEKTETENNAVSNNNSGSNNEIEEDDEEEKEKEKEKEKDNETQTEKAVVNITSSTLKSTTFEKEWAIVTGEEVLSDPQARASCECGRVPFNVPGGGVNEWPWTAAVVYNGFIAGGRPHCGATLINNKYALTSAHCMDGLLPGNTELWLTVHDNLQNSGSSSGTLKLPVGKILMHPNFHRNSRDNDIALIGLVDNVNIGDNHYFVPACVPAGSNNYQGVMGKMAAWSSTEYGPHGNRISNNKLCKAEMPVLGNDICNRDTSHTGKITTNMLCAGYLTPSIDTKCMGDAGGGLVIANGGRHTLIGVTSFGYKPNRAYSPTVHTRVSEYAEWILHNTRDADWCE